MLRASLQEGVFKKTEKNKTELSSVSESNEIWQTFGMCKSSSRLILILLSQQT